ncbi:MAG: phosphopantetheine-binding protein [Pseudomonadota bacterium]
MDDSALVHELKVLLIEELDLRARTPADIDEHAPLFGEGLGLDSLDALQLAMAIEERYGVRVPEGEESRAVFASVTALADFVRTNRAG